VLAAAAACLAGVRVGNLYLCQVSDVVPYAEMVYAEL